jgi:hypothetical protein
MHIKSTSTFFIFFDPFDQMIIRYELFKLSLMNHCLSLIVVPHIKLEFLPCTEAVPAYRRKKVFYKPDDKLPDQKKKSS